jgi:hypothetical protein
MAAVEIKRRLPQAEVAVVLDAVAGVAPDTTEAAFCAFRDAGVRTVASAADALVAAT